MALPRHKTPANLYISIPWKANNSIICWHTQCVRNKLDRKKKEGGRKSTSPLRLRRSSIARHLVTVPFACFALVGPRRVGAGVGA